VRFKVNGRSLLVHSARGGVFSIRAPAGSAVSAGGARDRYGNVAGAGTQLTP
jgi:hypothetical protein